MNNWATIIIANDIVVLRLTQSDENNNHIVKSTVCVSAEALLFLFVSAAASFFCTFQHPHSVGLRAVCVQYVFPSHIQTAAVPHFVFLSVQMRLFGHTVWKWNFQLALNYRIEVGDFMLAINLPLSGDVYAKEHYFPELFVNVGMVGRCVCFKIQDTCCVDRIRSSGIRTELKSFSATTQRHTHTHRYV